MTIYFTLSDENKKVSIKKLELIASHYKHMADTLYSNEVQALVKKWEGKKYTKKFETALKNINKYFRVDNTLSSFYLKFYFFDNRDFQLDNSCSVYVKGSYTVNGLDTSSYLDIHDIRKNLHEELLQRAREFQAEFEKINNQLYRLNEYIDKFNKIKDTYNELEHELDYEIMNEFNLYLQRR